MSVNSHERINSRIGLIVSVLLHVVILAMAMSSGVTESENPTSLIERIFGGSEEPIQVAAEDTKV